MKTRFSVRIGRLPFMAIAMASCLYICTSCDKSVVVEEEIDDPRGRCKVVFCNKAVSLSTDQLKGIVGDTMLCNRIKYGITCYKVRYTTLYRSKIVETDALLSIPDYNPGDSARFATYFHGTILPFKFKLVDTSLPSDFTGTTKSKDMMYCALPLAGAGYCVVTPDYTGYGPTTGMDHPFIYYPELYKSAVDGVEVCRKIVMNMMKEANRPIAGENNGRVDMWFSGWSQGGGLSLYMQRYYENEYNGIAHIRANSTLAGPFNIKHFILDMMEQPNKVYLVAALYSWAAYGINKFAVGRPNDQIFRLNIFDQVSAILVAPISPSELFQDFFMKHIKDGVDKKYLKALDDCSTSGGWHPIAPVYMHHGDADILVPIFNMYDAVDSLGGSGSAVEEKGYMKKGKIHYFVKKDGGHDTFVPEYMSKTIDNFKEN